MTPARSYAAEIRKIALNGDTGMRHIRQYAVQPDGSLKLAQEFFAKGNASRWIDPSGNQSTNRDGRWTTRYPDGSAIIQDMQNNSRWLSYSTKQILEVNDRPGVKMAVEHIHEDGLELVRFITDEEFIDGRGQKRHCHAILTADAVTDRPLEWQTDIAGLTHSVQTWEYPPDDPSLLEISNLDKSRLYDLDKQHRSLMAALGNRGSSQSVAGVRVELLQVWVGESGDVGAVAQADYICPVQECLSIDGSKSIGFSGSRLSSGPFSTVKPTNHNGRPLQIFFYDTTNWAPGSRYADTIDVQIPVFKGKDLAGYATFLGVKINRTKNVHQLLEPFAVPYWIQSSLHPSAQTTP